MAQIQRNKKVDNDFAMDLDDEKSSGTEKKSNKDGFSDNYEDDNWDMSDQDLQLEDKAHHNNKKEDAKPKDKRGLASPESSNKHHADPFGAHMEGSDKYSDFDMDAIEKEAADGNLEKKNGNMFG